MSEHTARAVVQIGRGPTGTALARQLVAALRPADRFVVIDRNPDDAHLPFGTTEPTHLINTRAAKSSIQLGDPGEFTRWMSENGHAAQEFPPRGVYGRYIQSVFDAAITEAIDRGVDVEIITDSAVGIDSGGDRRFRVKCARGRQIDADQVAICTGMIGQSDPFPAIVSCSDYVSNPWRLDSVPSDASVAVVGTRLTAIDVALSLLSRGHTGSIQLLSRSGKLPRVRGTEDTAPIGHIERAIERASREGGLRLHDFGRALMADVDAASTSVDWSSVIAPGATTRACLAEDLAEVDAGTPRGWQRVINAAAPILPVAWQLLVDIDRAEFLSRWLTPLLVHGAPIPPATARRIIAAMDDGQLRVEGGLLDIHADDNGFKLSTLDGSRRSDVVVNATGPGSGIDELRAEPLMAALFDAGLVTMHEHGGVQIDTATFSPVDSAGEPVTGLHLIGDVTRGAVLVTNDAVALSFQASLAAQAMVAAIADGVVVL